MSNLSVLFACGAFSFFLIAIIIAIYVINALALYTLAKNNGYENMSILAWIPFANMYLFGLLSGDIELFKKQKLEGNILGILLAVLPIVTGFPVLGFFAWIAFLVLYAHAIYYLLNKIDQSTALVLTLVSFFIPLVLVIYLFIKKDSIFDGSYIM